MSYALERPQGAGSGALMFHIGQERFKKRAEIRLDAAIEEGRPFPHTLFYGSAGLGKTTLAGIIAEAMGGRFVETTAGAVNSVRKAQELIMDLEPFDILFIDEIHSIKTAVAEEFYSVMQDFRWKGRDVPPFTMIGATTEAGDLPPPLRGRFKINYAMQPYTMPELARIVRRHVKISHEECLGVAIRCFGNPRIAVNYAEELRDIKPRYGNGDIDKIFSEVIGVDKIGMTEYHVAILRCLEENKGIAGFETIAFRCNIPKKDLRQIYEPNLLSIGFIGKSSRGRFITELGKDYLGNLK